MNHKFLWHSKGVKRITLQILFGVIVPFMIIMMFMAWYFSIVGYWILDTGWLKYCSAAIVIMLLFLNVINEVLEELWSKARVLNNSKFNTLKVQKKTFFRGRSYSDAVYINSSDRKNTIMFIDGTEYPYHLSIDFARTMLSEDTHILSKRGQLIRLASITRAKWVDGKRLRLQVYLINHENFEVIFSEAQTGIYKDLLKPFIGRIG